MFYAYCSWTQVVVFSHGIVILMFETGYMQVLYFGRKMSGHPTFTGIPRVDG